MSLVTFFSCSQVSQVAEELPFYNSADYTPEFIVPGTEAYDRIHTIGDFRFTNQLGEIVDQNTVKGKIIVTNFFFTVCPSICPKMTNNMELVYNEFRDDDEVILMSHTVMPWIDDVKKLKEYADNREIDAKRWYLLTGDKMDLYKMGRENYFVEQDYDKDETNMGEFLHTENTILIDTKGRIRGVYRGTYENEMKNIIEDIYILKGEGS